MIKIGDCIIAENESRDTVLPGSLPLITCGLSQKSSVTASSIDDDGFLYCVQRSFPTSAGETVMPQEFKVCWKKRRNDIYSCLALVTALLITGMTPCSISSELIL